MLVLVRVLVSLWPQIFIEWLTKGCEGNDGVAYGGLTVLLQLPPSLLYSLVSCLLLHSLVARELLLMRPFFAVVLCVR